MGINTKSFMRKYDIRPYKSWGQNFLIDNDIKEKIVSAACTGKDELVIEIGAGLGALSRGLAARAGRLAAIEADKRLIPALEEALSNYENVFIINDDILNLDIKNYVIPMACGTAGERNETGKLDGSVFTPGSIKVMGNLPYYITTPIIMKLLEEEPGIDEAIFMVQREVADRILAEPGTKEYGALSIAVRYYATPGILFSVPPSAFTPRPKVYSSVIKLVINKKAPVTLYDRSLFFKVVKAAFGQRRKTLVNALSNANIFSLSKEEIKRIVGSLRIHEIHGIDGTGGIHGINGTHEINGIDGIDRIDGTDAIDGIGENTRGEELSMEQFAQLSNAIYRNLSEYYRNQNLTEINS